MKYKHLSDAIEIRGIRKTTIAKALGINERTLRYKIEGDSPLSWEQACKIQEQFFPDMDMKTLFSRMNDTRTG